MVFCCNQLKVAQDARPPIKIKMEIMDMERAPVRPSWQISKMTAVGMAPVIALIMVIMLKPSSWIKYEIPLFVSAALGIIEKK